MRPRAIGQAAACTLVVSMALAGRGRPAGAAQQAPPMQQDAGVVAPHGPPPPVLADGAQSSAPRAKRSVLEAAELEQRDPVLRSALAQLTLGPTAERLCLVAEAYSTAGVLDQAYDRATQALQLDPGSARAFDLRARIWRRWGIPERGLGDAYRAVYLAPRSPEARNTLGTLLEALGKDAAALSAYERALRLEPSAGYARANLERVRVRNANGEPR